ncbi:MAG: glycosyltransferase family 4 protein [PVC group bacterium]
MIAAKLKLAYVVKYYRPMPRISGILRFVIDLIEELEADFSIRVFTFRYSPEVPGYEKCGGHEISRLPAPFPLRAGAAVRRWRPDLIIFGSGFWQPYYLLPYWELFRLGLRGCRAPVILTQYTTMTGRLSGLIRFLAPRPEAVIATTESLRKLWERFYPGSVTYIPPGMPLRSANEEIPQPEIPPSAFRIGFFGHLQPHKGPDILLRIFQEMNPENADLLINGEGEMEKELRKTARGWPNITIQGYAPEIDPWLYSCRLLVLPYRSSVSVLGYSRAALDALAAGIPVIATPSPAVADLIEEGENGFICRNDDELKSRIRQVIDDPLLWEKLSEGARRSSKQYDINKISRHYVHLIHTIYRGLG